MFTKKLFTERTDKTKTITVPTLRGVLLSEYEKETFKKLPLSTVTELSNIAETNNKILLANCNLEITTEIINQSRLPSEYCMIINTDCLSYLKRR